MSVQNMIYVHCPLGVGTCQTALADSSSMIDPLPCRSSYLFLRERNDDTTYHEHLHVLLSQDAHRGDRDITYLRSDASSGYLNSRSQEETERPRNSRIEN